MTKIKDVIRGDTRNIDVTFYQSDGTPINLTGGTVFFTVNESNNPSSDSSAVIQKDVISHTNPTAGETRITLSSSDTNIDPGTYYYDIQLKDSSNNITSAKQDRFIVIADIGRRTS